MWDSSSPRFSTNQLWSLRSYHFISLRLSFFIFNMKVGLDSRWRTLLNGNTEYSLSSCVTGPQAQAQWFLGALIGLGIQSQLGFVTTKGYKSKSSEEKVHEAKSRENQVQTIKSPFSVELYWIHLTLSATTCDNTCEVLSTRKAHYWLSTEGVSWGLAMEATSA